MGHDTRLLRQLGAAQVLRVDLSSDRIELAQAQERSHPLGIDDRVCDWEGSWWHSTTIPTPPIQRRGGSPLRLQQEHQRIVGGGARDSPPLQTGGLDSNHVHTAVLSDQSHPGLKNTLRHQRVI